jgi:dipeptidyl aminopeptidase/acylaminoacyl peptidase
MHSLAERLQSQPPLVRKEPVVAERRKLTPEDIYNIALVNDARISPDGSQVVYVRTELNREKNDYRSSLYLVPSAGGDARRFTGADAKDTMPRWSPDGSRIAFLSNRSGSNQLWSIPLAGGEAAQLTDLPEPVSAFVWSSKGDQIAFVSKADQQKIDEAKAKADKGEQDEPKSDVMRITRLRYRSDGTPGFLDNKPRHIWTIEAGGGAPKQITTGEFDDGEPDWSPDDSQLVFVSNRNEEREKKRGSEIWVVPSTGGEPTAVVAGVTADFSNPAWSPDGKLIAIEGHQNPYAGGAIGSDLWVVQPDGNGLRNVTSALDRTVGDHSLSDTASGASVGLVWSPDCSSVLYSLSDSGSAHVRRANIAGGETALVLGGRRRVMQFSASADGSKLAYVVATSTVPCDAYSSNADGSGETRLTSVNEEFLSTVFVSEPEEIHVPSQADDHADIHGWIMKPIGFEAGKQYPLVLEIHGGPHGMYANAYFHEFQLLAAQGYVVVYGNPRGSQGYGNDFSSCTKGVWGSSDMPDVMALVDYAIEQGYVDSKRLGVTGGSYGGFLTNWIIGHTDRFKAAVTQRPVSNMHSFYGTSDIGSTFGDYETGGTPWANTEQFIKMSPIAYVDKIKTPLLIVHSEEDYRCPIEQAEQLFVSLKMLNQTVELLRFPNESHGLSRMGKPTHRVERLEAILGWFEEYL